MHLTFRDYQPHDEQLICSLFSKVFKQNMTLDFWRWRFLMNPYGNKKISLCFDQDQLIGHYAVSPIDFIENGKVLHGAQSMTTMIHPGYQRQGLFTRLAIDQYDKIKEQNLDFVWGLPNRNSYYGLVKSLSWQPISELPFLKCSDSEATLRCDLRVTETAPLRIELERFLTQNMTLTTFQLNRTADYIQWRYIDNPLNTYQLTYFYSGSSLVGLLITKAYPTPAGTFKDILELITFDVAMTKQILSWARYTFLHVERNSGLYAWCSLSDPNYLMYFQEKFNPHVPLTYLCVLPFNTQIKKIATAENWMVSMGDSDVF